MKFIHFDTFLHRWHCYNQSVPTEKCLHRIFECQFTKSQIWTKFQILSNIVQIGAIHSNQSEQCSKEFLRKLTFVYSMWHFSVGMHCYCIRANGQIPLHQSPIWFETQNVCEHKYFDTFRIKRFCYFCRKSSCARAPAVFSFTVNGRDFGMDFVRCVLYYYICR